MPQFIEEDYTWANFSALVGGVTMVGVKAVDYSSEVEVKTHYAKGQDPMSYGEGQWKASGKLTLTRKEYLKLAALGAGDVLTIPPFPIVLMYEVPTTGEKHKTTLPLVKIKKDDHKMKEGDTEMPIDLDIELLVRPVTIPI